ncbi:MAG: GEVED domain-containing protein, partial [Pseudomonadota bacterium]
MVLVVWSLSASTLADPLNECPSRAFLSQRTNATLYAINLVTGHFELLEDRMGAGKINAIGFSVHDRYFYAWSYQHDSVARIGDDYQIESMNMQNITNNGFFVGDVAVTENAYYVYRRGGNYGLYRIPLNPDADDYLQMSRVVDGSTLDLRIFDLAFHPTNGTAYAVDSSGRLWEINVQSGSATQLANVGQTGTFGAGYFDVEGRLYFSRNKDGNVFVVDIDQQQYTASLFALGPSSSTNDGARCALAPVTDSNNTDIDFGDAPQSYGTMLADNGARHGLSLNPSLYLGDGVDGESDASPAPLADDSVDGNDDEDGVDFATGLQAGNTAILVVRAAAVGNLNAWIDVNQSGTFDAGEQIISDRTVTEGTNLVAVNIPASADVGDTWARFRLSSSSGVPPTGGVSDGEVEDYPVTIGASDSATVWYPSKATVLQPLREGYQTVAESEAPI